VPAYCEAIFIGWTGKALDELLIEAEQQVKSGKLMRQRNIKKYLIGFGKYSLEERENADLAVKNHLTGKNVLLKSLTGFLSPRTLIAF
jgi:hypothetical protein